MTAILTWLFTNPTILGIGAAIIGAIGLAFQQRVAGAKAERNAQKAKDADAYEQSLRDIAAAGNARSSVDVSKLPDNDPYRRD